MLLDLWVTPNLCVICAIYVKGLNICCLYLCYGYDMLLGTCMNNVLLEAIWWNYVMVILCFLEHVCINVLLEAIWRKYVGYDDYENDMQMVDSELWWIVLSMRMMDDNPKHDCSDVLHVS